MNVNRKYKHKHIEANVDIQEEIWRLGDKLYMIEEEFQDILHYMELEMSATTEAKLAKMALEIIRLRKDRREAKDELTILELSMDGETPSRIKAHKDKQASRRYTDRTPVIKRILGGQPNG